MAAKGSAKRRRGKSDGRGRFTRGADAQDQLLEISGAQQRRRKRKSKQIIDSIRKSEQRLENDLNQIKTLDDAIKQFG